MCNSSDNICRPRWTGVSPLMPAPAAVRMLFHVRFMLAVWFKYQFMPVVRADIVDPFTHGLPPAEVMTNVSVPLPRSVSSTVSIMDDAPCPPMRSSNACTAAGLAVTSASAPIPARPQHTADAATKDLNDNFIRYRLACLVIYNWQI